MYSTLVFRRRPIIHWTRLAAVAFVTSGRLLVADDQAPASADGYKTVNSNGNGLPVRVKEDKDPLANVASHDTDGKYDPERIFSRSSSMANKSFSNSGDVAATGHNDYNKSSTENTFITKSYSFNKTSSVADLSAKASFPTTPLSNQTSTDFSKSFHTASADLGSNHAAAFASAKAEEQDRTAAIGDKTSSTFASTLGNKAFLGDEADSAKKRLTHMKDGQYYVQDLPNRPLTIDEVRELINHGFKPDTDKAPVDEASKPLNDPDYVPKPIRESPDSDTPVAAPVTDEDKDDAVPPPGTMSSPPPPENSQPLPQR